MTIEGFKNACEGVMMTKTISTFPLPGEIAAALNCDKGLEAWLSARKIVRRHGAGMSVIFPDPVIHSVIEAMGGWQKFCWIPETDLTWKQKEFERLYPLMSNRNRHPERLSGYLEEGTVDLKQKTLPGAGLKELE